MPMKIRSTIDRLTIGSYADSHVHTDVHSSPEHTPVNS